MKFRFHLAAMVITWSMTAAAQSNFRYDVQLEPIQIPGLQGLHSFAFAQHEGKWLLIGGRKDGIHARQPFRSFPQALSNNQVVVVDIDTKKVWTASTSQLPTSLDEQLQSTNMNFFQEEDTLLIAGGYGFAPSAGDHITFPFLTAVDVPGLVNAVVNGTGISSYFRQITDERFAVTGGELGRLNGEYLLVGGHRFDGRYNPMGHATYTQAYTNKVLKFKINNSGGQLTAYGFNSITDAVHLRRRDFNLVPMIYESGEEGYMISSGVFQQQLDQPYLYPVEIRPSGITPRTDFNQYLSNYHSAKTSLYDSAKRIMYTIFFGGISQFYYENEQLKEDKRIPFVSTISLVERWQDGTYHEFVLPASMPGLKGAGAAFLPHHQWKRYSNEVLLLDNLNDTILLGHIAGGIQSNLANPFQQNNTEATSAITTMYAVRLVKTSQPAVSPVDGRNPFDFNLFPNPTDDDVTIRIASENVSSVHYLVAGSSGRLLDKGFIPVTAGSAYTGQLNLASSWADQVLFITLVFNNRYYVTKKLLRIK